MAATGRRRGYETVGDMARSLALVVGIVLVLMLLVWHRNGPDIHTVDYASVGAAAQADGAYEVYVPVGLPGDEDSGWRATSVRYHDTIDSETATVWHVGFVSPTGHYAALDQTDGPADDVLARVAPDVEPAEGTLEIVGLTWARYDPGSATDDETKALVATLADSALVVSGTADWGELERLAGSLQTG